MLFYCVYKPTILTFFPYLMAKKFRRQKVFVGKRWRNFQQVAKVFSDEYFLPTKFSTDEISTDKVGNTNVFCFISFKMKMYVCFMHQTQRKPHLGAIRNLWFYFEASKLQIDSFFRCHDNRSVPISIILSHCKLNSFI